MLLTSNSVYFRYIILFVVTIFGLSFLPTYVIDFELHFRRLIMNINKLVKDLFSSGVKEKNEDENCEYDMMWDAEGGMHLIKKPCKAPTVVSKEMNSSERFVDLSIFILLTSGFAIDICSFHVLALPIS